jgi:hypothetical protein
VEFDLVVSMEVVLVEQQRVQVVEERVTFEAPSMEV